VKAHKRRHSSSSSSKNSSKAQPLQSNGESPITVEANQTEPKTEPDTSNVVVDGSSSVHNELHAAVPSPVSTHIDISNSVLS
jgi:lipopolysaccharide export system protein LptA